MWNREGKYTVYIVTPKGEVIRANFNRKKNVIKSLTRGGIEKLRSYDWNIGKRRKKCENIYTLHWVT